MPIKTYLSALFVLFLSHNALAQSAFDTTKWELKIIGGDSIYFKKPTAADKAREEGDLMGAIPLFRKEILDDTDVIIKYNLACAYALTNQKDSAFRYLTMAIKNDSSAYALVDPDFYNLISDKRWEKIEEQQLVLREARWGKIKDVALAKELWRMKIKDQAYYWAIEIADKKYGMKSATADSLWKLKRALGDGNLKRLEEIIAKKGWPKISEVGNGAAKSAFLIIQHADLATQKKYKPMLEAAANNKETEWSALALLIDRIETSENRPQIYGSQVKYNEQTKAYEPFPIVDEKNLDKRRKQVGLGTAKEYYSNWDIDYKVEQNTY